LRIRYRRGYYYAILRSRFIRGAWDRGFSISCLVSRALALGPGKEGKVEGSQLQLYKAKEGSKKHEASYA